MTGRSAAVQGGLAALGLLAAHLTWQREPEHAPGAVTVIDAGKSDVTKISYEDDGIALDLSRGRGSEPPVWIHMVTKAKPEPKAPDKPGDKPPAAPPKSPPPRDLGGAEAAVKLYDQFSPLLSPRAFGVLDATKLKELGLDAPKRKLEVTVKGDVRHYEIGQPANATGGESFLRDTRDGRVYLMPRAMLNDLQSGNRLVDRKLHTFDLPEFDRIVLASGGKQKELLQVGRESRATAGFASPKTPDKRDQMAKNWHDSLWRAFPIDLLGRGEDPPGGKPAIALRVDYFDGKKSIGWIEIAKVESTAGGMSEETSGPAAEVFVRSEHTSGWAKISSGGQLLADAQKLIAAP